MSELIAAEGLTKIYRSAGGGAVHALRGVGFSVARGEVLGVVGESGCGKSTLGRTLLRLIEPTAGTIRFDGIDFTALSGRALKARRRDLQIVFQDPFGSLNPRHSVGRIVAEPLVVHGVGDAASRRARVAELLALVGLAADAGGRYPHEFSGGQRQRIAIARALALEPAFLVADEPVSALDVSIQSQIINLVAALRARFGLSILFISHDLSVIRHVADRICVMYLGEIVEIGPAAALFEAPAHPYAQALLSAVPRIGTGPRPARIVLDGDPPDPSLVTPGCAFAGRCRHVMAVCRDEKPALVERVTETGRTTVACHLYRVPGSAGHAGTTVG